MTKIIYLALAFFSLCLSHLLFSQKNNTKIQNLSFYGNILLEKNKIAFFDDKIKVISNDEKSIFLLIKTEGIVDQKKFNNLKEVNDHYLKIDGILVCSYAWNGNSMKLVLEKTKAKKILVNTFAFEISLVSNLF